MNDQTRAEAVAETRRKRDVGATDPSLNRFGVGSNILDMDKYVYRSVADDGNRLFLLTEQDDYDFVTNKGEGSRKGDAAGVLRYQHAIVDGQPRYTYLLRKSKQFDHDDRRKRLSKVDAEEKLRMEATVPDQDLKDENTYKPRTPKN